MDNFHVQIDATRPATFDRPQVLVRLLILGALSAVGVRVWPIGFFYLLLPLSAAVLVTSHGAADFIERDAPRMVRALRWLFGVYAYLTFVVDRLPLGTEEPLRMQIAPAGTPTPGSALLRLITSIPSALVLLLWGMLSGMCVMFAALCVLFTTTYPASLWAFQLAVLRWQARLFAYHASLVESYPPFSLDASRTDRTSPPSAPMSVGPA